MAEEKARLIKIGSLWAKKDMITGVINADLGADTNIVIFKRKPEWKKSDKSPDFDVMTGEDNVTQEYIDEWEAKKAEYASKGDE